MKKIIIIIICLVVIIGGGFIFMVYKNKPSKVILDQSQINNNNIIIEKLFTSFNKNDFDTYKNIVNSAMDNKNVFNEIKSTFNKDFGDYQKATYKEAFAIKGNIDLIYSVSFSKKNPVTVSITMNNNNKVAGIHV